MFWPEPSFMPFCVQLFFLASLTFSSDSILPLSDIWILSRDRNWVICLTRVPAPLRPKCRFTWCGQIREKQRCHRYVSYVASESDFHLRRLWGEPSENVPPKISCYFTVGYNQRENI